MDGELRTSELPALSKADIAAIQTRVSRRVLRWFVRRGWLDPDDARAMREWHNDGGFSLDAVRVETVITFHPPHRSGRDQFSHPVPR